MSHDPWYILKKYTQSRIALGRAGGSIPTKPYLQFQLDHARAKDAVESALDVFGLERQLKDINLPLIKLRSQAKDRSEYLKRPDLGRKLSDRSRVILSQHRKKRPDIGIVVADGLSAAAIDVQFIPFLNEIIPRFQKKQMSFSPVCLVEQGRVAIADEIGELLHCKLVFICIGERPGLSSPHSMGIYMTYGPESGKTDESRNCISNIRLQGLSAEIAAQKLMFLIEQSLKLKLSGVNLKENMDVLLE
jgi:ethanolamine ammonia-lyase small subunit